MIFVQEIDLQEEVAGTLGDELFTQKFCIRRPLSLSTSWFDISDGGTSENCGIIAAVWGGWLDWICKVGKVDGYLKFCCKIQD